MEEKGLRVNVGKTKVMKCQVGSGQVKNSGKWPCGVCRKGVGRNSICCAVRNGFTRDVVGRQGDCKILLGFDALDVLLTPMTRLRSWRNRIYI